MKKIFYVAICFLVTYYGNSQTAEEFINHGLSLYVSGDFQGAITEYSKALKVDRKSARAYNYRGLAKMKLYDLADYKKALEIDSTAQVYNRNMGFERTALINHEVIPDFSKAIKNDPKYAEAYYNRGVVKYCYENYKGAIDDWTKAIQVNPKYVDAYNDRGLAKSIYQQFKGAIDDWTKAIEIDPKNVNAYNNRAVLNYNHQKYRVAIDDWTKVIQIDPKLAFAYINRGLAKIATKDYQGALEDETKAIEINSKSKVAYNNRGFAKSMLLDYKGAIEDYNKAIEIEPKYPEAYSNRGVAKIKSGQKDEGCSDLRKAEKLGFPGAFQQIKENCE